MSLIGDNIIAGLAALANAKGEALGYNVNNRNGPFTSLSGFVLDRDEPLPPEFSEQDGAEVSVQTGWLSGPLTPALAVGYFLQDGSGHVWAIQRVDFDQQQRCIVKRTTIDNAGPNRGGAN